MELAQSTTSFAPAGNEQALVAAARRGDDRAFEILYSRYRDRVQAFIQSKIRDHGRAEDIAQEVFMAALRQLRATDRPIAFKPWIFAIAKNACIDEFRRTARGREVPVENDDVLPGAARGTLSLAPPPPVVMEGKQRLDDLRDAFGGLSESHHKLLVMRELEGRSYDEIGDRLGMTRQMVESSLFRARRKLSVEYDELASGARCEQVQTMIDTGAGRALRTMGIKQRRRISRHLSHCDACRHQARLAGVDETLLKPRSLPAKIAALLPFGGLWRWPWRGGHGGGKVIPLHAGSGQAAGKAAAGKAAAGGAAQAAGTAGSSITLGQAAAAAAALALAGAGGGLALVHHDGTAHFTPASSRSVQNTVRNAASSAGAAVVPAIASTPSHAGGAPGRAAHTAGLSAAGGVAHGSTKRPAPNAGQTHRPVSGGSSGSSGGGAAPSHTTGTTTPGSGLRSRLPLSTAHSTATTVKTIVGGTLGSAGGAINKTAGTVTKVVGSVLNTPPVKTVSGVLNSPPAKKIVGTVGSSVGSTVGSLTGPLSSGVAGAGSSGAGSSGSSGVSGSSGTGTSGSHPTSGSPTSGGTDNPLQRTVSTLTQSIGGQ